MTWRKITESLPLLAPRTISVGLVTIVAAAIATAIGVYIHLAVQSQTAAELAVQRHEQKRISAAHQDAPQRLVTRIEYQNTVYKIQTIQRDVADVRKQQRRHNNKLDDIRRLLRKRR